MKNKRLLTDLKQHKKYALHQCISEYYNTVSCIIEAVIGKSLSREDKEEVIADVFISLWKYADNIDDVQYMSIKPYLCKIARNKAKNALRKCGNINRCSLPLDEAILVSVNDEMSDAYIKKELKNALQGAVNSLKEEERQCFIQYYYCQMPIRMISKELGISESAIKLKLFRGRKKLRDLLLERGIQYENYEDLF